jgi:hypothetical protein
MAGAERLLLERCGFTQEMLGGGIIAGRGRLFGVFDDRASFARFRHSGSSLRSDGREGGAVNLTRITNRGQLYGKVRGMGRWRSVDADRSDTVSSRTA